MLFRPIKAFRGGIHMKRRRLVLFFLCVIACSSFSGIQSSRDVTLGSIEIYTTHELIGSDPTVYFQCRGENRTVLPDVKKTHFLYAFKGVESWQPLTVLAEKKCKRCGLFEKDSWKPDDVFDEWELCPDDFVDGKFIHFQDKEFNATFICLECTASAGSGGSSSKGVAANRKTNVVLVIIICILAFILVAIVSTVTYMYWQKRKKEQDQARFLKLFEEVDDIEDELGIAPV